MVKKSKFLSILLVIIFCLTICVIPSNAKSREVIIGGESFGLKLYCKGVMVLRLERFKSGIKTVCPAKSAGIEVNDIITEANDKVIKSNEQFSKTVKTSMGKEIKLKIIRNNTIIRKAIKPEKNKSGVYYTGMWIRDSCAGLGTISYYDPINSNYGALGHGICDIDTGGLMRSESGEVISAYITSVSKSNSNNIGTLNGYFTDNKIGNIKSNTPLGIYGKYSNSPDKKNIYTIAEASEIKIGKAYMYSTIKGVKPQKYTVRILAVCSLNPYSNRNLIIKIDDKKLIKKTNGIVQGMSGSPIVQDDKFIGALTHVFVDDSTMGYAILATNMINN